VDLGPQSRMVHERRVGRLPLHLLAGPLGILQQPPTGGCECDLMVLQFLGTRPLTSRLRHPVEIKAARGRSALSGSQPRPQSAADVASPSRPHATAGIMPGMCLDGYREQIALWVREGLSDKSIAERVRVSPSTVRYWRGRNGIKRPAKIRASNADEKVQ
jgi:hypothetical protein